jgi:hypothetical protein
VSDEADELAWLYGEGDIVEGLYLNGPEALGALELLADPIKGKERRAHDSSILENT